MPYSGPNDPKIPSHVAESDKAQWVKVFNSSFAKCTKDGGSTSKCEGEAFKIANGVVKKDKSMPESKHEITFTDKVLDFFKGLKKRSVSVSAIMSHAFDSIYSSGSYPMDLYVDTDGSMFITSARDGKLYMNRISVTGTEVTIDDPIEVEAKFEPITRVVTRSHIIREASGRVRWLSISATSVLDRVGEIDSTKLFSSFEEHCRKTGEYPFRTFYHLGERLRTGQADFVARDGNALVTSGLYDDSELARREIAAREANPSYWGESIGYIATEEPEMLDVADGIKIAVWNSGILREISTVGEERAASLYTNWTSIQEVTRTMTMSSSAFKDFVKLFDDDETAAKAWLESNVGDVDELIRQRNQITRDVEGNAAESTPEEDTPVTEEAPAVEGAAVITEAEVVESQVQEVIVDDGLLATIIQGIETGEVFQGFKTVLADIQASLLAITEKQNGLEIASVRTVTQIEDLKQTVGRINTDDNTKIVNTVNDLSKNQILHRAVYRPSASAETTHEEAAKPSMDKIAADTLAKMQ